MSRTGALVSSSVAALVAVALWVLSGTLSISWHVYGGASIVLPYTGGAVQLAGSGTEAWVLGVAVLVAVVGALAVPVAKARSGGWPVVVLAMWFVAAAGAGLASLVRAYALGLPSMDAIGTPLEVLTSGAYWGAVWGWAVGLAVVLVQRRALRAEDPPTDRAALMAALTAALVGGLGWLVIGGLRSWADGQIYPAVTEARDDAAHWAATLLPVPGGWWTSQLVEGAPRLLPGALVVALLEGALTYVAARTVHRRLGRTAFTFAVWFAAIAAAVLATTVMYTGIPVAELTGQVPVLSQLVLVGGQLGVQYGWFDALIALLVLVVVDRRTRPRDDVPAEAMTTA